jgi:hypothetical protein
MLGLAGRRPRALAEWRAANVLVAAGWSWWAAISVAQVAEHSPNIAWIAPPTVVDAWRTTETAYLPSYVAGAGWSAGLLLAALFVAAGWAAARDRRPATLLLAILAVGAPLVLFALSQIQPIFLVRTLYWASAPAWILIAVALARRADSRVAWTIVVVVAAVEIAALVTWLPAREREGWPDAIAAIASAAPDATVFVEGDAMALAAAHYRDRIAPRIRIVALTPDDPYDGWAEGLYRGPRTSFGGAAMLLRRAGTAFTLVRGPHNPADALSTAGERETLLELTANRQPVIERWHADGR